LQSETTLIFGFPGETEEGF
jgi:2-methylthioadenine synthetase